jgi:hypothetical protein
MHNYLFIDKDGKIMVKDEVLNKADEAMNKVKSEVKEKKERKKREPKKKESPKKESPKPKPKKEKPVLNIDVELTVKDMNKKQLLRAYFFLLNCRSFQAGSQTKFNIQRLEQDKKELKELENKYHFSKKEEIKPLIEEHMKMNHVLRDWGLPTYDGTDQEYKCFNKSYKKLHNYLIALVEKEKATQVKGEPTPREAPVPKKEEPKKRAKLQEQPMSQAEKVVKEDQKAFDLFMVVHNLRIKASIPYINKQLKLYKDKIPELIKKIPKSKATYIRYGATLKADLDHVNKEVENYENLLKPEVYEKNKKLFNDAKNKFIEYAKITPEEYYKKLGWDKNANEDDKLIYSEIEEPIIKLPEEPNLSSEQKIRNRLKELKKLGSDIVVNYDAGQSTGVLFQLVFLRKYKYDCILSFPNTSNKKIAGLRLYLTKNKKWEKSTPESLAEVFYPKVKKCFENESKIIIIPLSLRISSNEGHCNMIILKLDTRTAYRFEPHGKRLGDEKNSEEKINKLLVGMFENKELVKNLGKIKYVPPSETCPYISKSVRQGFQSMENQYLFSLSKSEQAKLDKAESGGFCQAWSWFLVDLYMMNKDMTIEDIYIIAHDELENDPETFRNTVRGYILDANKELAKFSQFNLNKKGKDIENEIFKYYDNELIKLIDEQKGKAKEKHQKKLKELTDLYSKD